MSERQETVREVCAEMNYCKATSYSSGGCNDCNNFDCRDVRRFADRILAAHEREMNVVRQCLTGDCERFKLGAEPCTTCTVCAYEREMASKDAEIARLKAALKPVMECAVCKVDGTAVADGEICTSSDYGVCDYEGNQLDWHDVAECLDAVLEAQRIMKEGE